MVAPTAIAPVVSSSRLLIAKTGLIAASICGCRLVRMTWIGGTTFLLFKFVLPVRYAESGIRNPGRRLCVIPEPVSQAVTVRQFAAATMDVRRQKAVRQW